MPLFIFLSYVARAVNYELRNAMEGTAPVAFLKVLPAVIARRD